MNEWVFVHRIIILKILTVIILIGFTFFIFITLFYLLPIETTSLAIDWKLIWSGIRGGGIQYQGTGLYNPPWSLIPILPLGLIPFRVSWAFISIFTLLILVMSVPRGSARLFYVISSLLLATSFPSIRHLADGNLEGLVISGILLCLYGYKSGNYFAFSMGMLLSSAKPQETWLFLLFIGIGYSIHWSYRRILYSTFLVIAVIIPSMILSGEEWLQVLAVHEQRGSIMDSGLISSLNRLGIPAWVIWFSWLIFFAVTLLIALNTRNTFSRIKSGYLVSASLLLAPYAAGNSLLTVLAIGAVPLFLISPLVGFLVFAAANLQYLFPVSFRYNWGAVYHTSMFMLNWFVLGFFTWREMIENGNLPE